MLESFQAGVVVNVRQLHVDQMKSRLCKETVTDVEMVKRYQTMVDTVFGSHVSMVNIVMNLVNVTNVGLILN